MSTSAEISAKMRRVHSTNTTPEILFRKALWRKGFRFQTYSAELPGKPDIVLGTKQLAIFIDGDFWHGGQWQHRGKLALEDQFGITASRDYWLEKIRRNMARDCLATNTLIISGWTVLRFWESDIHHNLKRCIDMTTKVIERKMKPTSFSLLPRKSFAEFFAGVGLMRMGLERQGWSAEFANDIEQKKKEMYSGHFEEDGVPYVVRDIHQLIADQIPRVTLATASFPCNDLSLAGARGGLKAGSSSSFWGFVEILKNMGAGRPPLVLLENVTGFLTSRQGSDFSEALATLNDLGYSVDAFIVDAINFVPQSRQRLFVVGIQDAIGNHLSKEFKLTEKLEGALRPKVLADFIASNPEIRWRIRPLPPPPVNHARFQDIIEDLVDEASHWWSDERAEYLLNQMSPKHREQANKMIAGSRWSYGTVFRRMRNGKSMAELRVDGIAGCLRTPRGGSGRQIVFKAGKGRYQVRLLTPREAARLMGADNYRISVPLNQALFGFGDGVCVRVIEWIAQYYLNPLVNELLHGRPLKAMQQKA